MWQEATPIVFAAALLPLLVLLTIGLLMVINRLAEKRRGKRNERIRIPGAIGSQD